MRIPVWVAELATEFWTLAKVEEPFPRKLLGPIARAVPLFVVFPPVLTIDSIRNELRKRGIPCNVLEADRAVRACLVASNGHGIALIDATDSENEQRFSIAHELAHFLRDYLFCRQKVCKRLGPDALKILDGIRSPSVNERLRAVVTQTPIGFHVHLMERHIEDHSRARAIEDSEASADRLAYELLAPAGEIASRLSLKSIVASSDVVDLLTSSFGLPVAQASRYAGLLLNSGRRLDPLVTQLKIAANNVEL